MNILKWLFGWPPNRKEISFIAVRLVLVAAYLAAMYWVFEAGYATVLKIMFAILVLALVVSFVFQYSHYPTDAEKK